MAAGWRWAGLYRARASSAPRAGGLRGQIISRRGAETQRLGGHGAGWDGPGRARGLVGRGGAGRATTTSEAFAHATPVAWNYLGGLRAGDPVVWNYLGGLREGGPGSLELPRGPSRRRPRWSGTTSEAFAKAVRVVWNYLGGLHAGGPGSLLSSEALRAGGPGSLVPSEGLRAGGPGSLLSSEGLRAGGRVVWIYLGGLRAGGPGSLVSSEGLRAGGPGSLLSSEGLRAGGPGSLLSFEGLPEARSGSSPCSRRVRQRPPGSRPPGQVSGTGDDPLEPSSSLPTSLVSREQRPTSRGGRRSVEAAARATGQARACEAGSRRPVTISPPGRRRVAQRHTLLASRLPLSPNCPLPPFQPNESGTKEVRGGGSAGDRSGEGGRGG